MTKDDDIVERLRWSAASTEVHELTQPYGVLLDEAADTITRLRAQPDRAACPQAGYDQLGKSHFCLDCLKHWYGDDAPCTEADCPFRSLAIPAAQGK